MRVKVGLSIIILSAAWATTQGQVEDLRERYGTRNMEAARLIKTGLELATQKQFTRALQAFDAALRLDGQCQMAHFQRGMTLIDMGRVTQGLASFKKAIELGQSVWLNVNAAINMGLTLARLRRIDEARYWLTQAVLLDPTDAGGLRWVAYRNLAIGLHDQKRHLSALLAALLAREANRAKVERKLVEEFAKLADAAEEEEAVRVLCLTEKPRLDKPAARTAKSDLAKVATLGGEPLAEQIRQLLPDPRGRFTVAVPQQAKHYYLVRGGPAPAARKINMNVNVRAACMVGSKLFLVLDGPSRLVEAAADSGTILQSHPLGHRTTGTVGVLPSLRSAYMSCGQQIVHLDLKTGVVTATKKPGFAVVAHPTRDMIYAYTTDFNRRETATLLIDGRPVTLLRDSGGMSQSVLYGFAAAGATLHLAEMRFNAASNARGVVVSPDGLWVAVPGGGGWRPEGKRGGYVVPVYAADDLSFVLGTFQTDAYPCGFAFNPVTGQVAAVREKDAHVYHLAGGEASATLAGKFTGACAWSGDGKLLLLANAGSGLTAYRNRLGPDEQARSQTWWKAVQAQRPTSAPPPGPRVQATAIREIAAFAPSKDRRAVARALARAFATGRSERLTPWRTFGPYVGGKALAALMDIVESTRSADSAGIRVYQIRKALEKYPNEPILTYHLADAHRYLKQTDEAKVAYLQTIRRDAGRTDLTLLGLDGLAKAFIQQDDPLSAIHCLAVALWLDRANPGIIQRLGPLLAKNNFKNEAGRLRALRAASAVPATAGLPVLPDPPGKAHALPAPKLYAAAIGSVVMVQRGDAGGSGVCVAQRGIVLTSRHVLAGRGRVVVYPFVLIDGKPKRLRPHTATILAQATDQDLAVLKLDQLAPSLVPLPVAVHSPTAGDKVYAIGSPGLGRGILEQSITEGIVSARERVVEGRKYLQHSAAINPGNSGGPLLNDKGQVVGINTLVASLNNVGFAIPPETIRALFPKK